ncbi:MAG: SDR family oxidoreductase [Blastocatellia bacterium]|nr:SDR family oxidoreductase [Blastocatellia bacterium]
MKRLQDKVALITGASKGIGRGIAEAFAAEGAHLILTARSETLLAELARSLEARGATALAIAADVTDEGQVEAVFQQALAKFSRLDILVNNAGVFDGGPLDQLSLDAWEKVMAVNLRGPFLCTREAMRVMKRQRVGRIINVGSISAQRVRPNAAAYNTSKHGLWGLTQSTALEGRAFGITCGCLHPGNTEVETLAPSRKASAEPVMKIEDWVDAAVAMAAMPPNINLLEAIILPIDQPYLGRG